MISVLVVVSFLLSMCLTRMFMSPSSRLRVMDHPNERSLHTVPVPRAGGVAILIAFFVGMGLVALLLDTVVSPVIVLSALLIAGISFLDDCYSLGVAFRFVIHFSVAILLVMNGFRLDSFEFPGGVWQWHEYVATTVSCFLVVWLINLYNFMDGMDGFAAGMAIIGFSSFALLGWQAQHQLFMSANLIIVSAVIGFILFNFPPAKIFMGDTGSSTLGFFAAAFSLWASADEIFPIWVALLIFSPFVVDASVTLLRRLVRGERIWEAHKSHYYQRLVQIGWGHKKTVLYSYALMLMCAVSSYFAIQFGSITQLLTIAAWIIIYISIIIAIGMLENRYKRGM